jgi:hypothetical protein
MGKTMTFEELVTRRLYSITDPRALENLKDGDWIVGVDETGIEVLGFYDAIANTVPGLPGNVMYWRQASPADEHLATYRRH